MSIENLLNSPTRSKTIIELSIDDLKTVVGDVIKEERLKAAEEARQKETIAFLSRYEVCKLLGVSRSTLYTWDKSGYLKSVKFGRKVLYAKKDVENLMSV